MDKQHLENTINLLLEENKLQTTTIARLEQSNCQLQEKLIQLEATNQALLEENHYLKERLTLNSTNSSLPPSRDLYKTKKENKQPSGRKPAGQPGHPGHSYKPMVADQVIDVFPEVCKCGEAVLVTDKYTREQKVEIPPIRPYVTEYRRWQGKCTKCGKKTTAALPQGVEQDMLGSNAKAIITTLNGCFSNSKRELQDILADIFHLPISLGLITDTAKRVNEKLVGIYDKLQEEIQTSPYLHIDETGHKNRDKRGWCWVFATKEHSLLKLTPSRGKQVLLDALPAYQGKVISDRYSAYNYFSAHKRQICWAHLVRNYQRLAHSSKPALAFQGQRLVAIGYRVFALDKAFTNKQIEESYFLRRIGKLQKEIQYIFKLILRIRGIPGAHGVIKRMQTSFDMMWSFVKDRAIDMTNNLAERQLRKYVIYRKKQLFTWSEWGNRYLERILSLFLTARLQKASAFERLSLAIAN